MAGNGIGDVSGMPFRPPIVAFNYGAASHGQPNPRHFHGKTSEKMGIPIRTGDDHDQAGYAAPAASEVARRRRILQTRSTKFSQSSQ